MDRGLELWKNKEITTTLTAPEVSPHNVTYILLYIH